MTPWVNFLWSEHPALVSPVRSAVLPQCLRAWAGGYRAYIFHCNFFFFFEGRLFGGSAGEGSGTQPRGVLSGTGLPGGSSIGGWGQRGRSCPFLCPTGGSGPPPLSPLSPSRCLRAPPAPRGAAGPAAGARGRCGRGADAGRGAGAQPGRGLRTPRPSPSATPRLRSRPGKREGGAPTVMRWHGMGGFVRVLLWGRVPAMLGVRGQRDGSICGIGAAC